jgi:hypothetical protein
MGGGLKQDAIARLQRWDRALKALKELAQTAMPKIAETKPIKPAPQSLKSPYRCGSGLKSKRCCASRGRQAPSNPVGQ